MHSINKLVSSIVNKLVLVELCNILLVVRVLALVQGLTFTHNIKTLLQ